MFNWFWEWYRGACSDYTVADNYRYYGQSFGISVFNSISCSGKYFLANLKNLVYWEHEFVIRGFQPFTPEEWVQRRIDCGWTYSLLNRRTNLMVFPVKEYYECFLAAKKQDLKELLQNPIPSYFVSK